MTFRWEDAPRHPVAEYVKPKRRFVLIRRERVPALLDDVLPRDYRWTQDFVALWIWSALCTAVVVLSCVFDR